MRHGARYNYDGRDLLSTVSEKQIKKELKGLRKEVKKRKNLWALLAALYLSFLLGDEKEIREVEKEGKKISELTAVKNAVSQYFSRQDADALVSLEGEFGKFWEKVFQTDVDEDLKQSFKSLPSQLFKAEVCKILVPKLLERGDADSALYFLNQVEKVKDPHIWLFLGWAYDSKGISNLAKDFLEKAAKEGLEEAKRRLALLCVKQGDFPKAAKLYEDMGELSEAVECYLEAKDVKGALKLVQSIDDSKLKIKVAFSLVEKGKGKDALKLLGGVLSPEADVLRAKVVQSEDLESAFSLAKEALPAVTGRLKEWALEIIARYYRENGMWKELVSVLSPLEVSGRLPLELRLSLAEGYMKLGEEARSLKILASLLEGDLRRKAKSLIKEIKKSTQSEEIKEICENILNEDSFFKRLKEGLKKSKDSIIGRLEELIEDKRQVRDVSLEELEEILLAADVGVEATEEIIGRLKKRIEIGDVKTGPGLIKALEEEILRILKSAEGQLRLDAKPTVIMVVGVNGTGKTTTIAKLGYLLKSKGYSVIFAAGDTFRAAAIEQLETWGHRVGIPVIKQKPGADPSGVVYDAVMSAKARGVDVVIIDTAGRLHTKVNLMEELKKMARVASKEVPGAPHETLLVLDAVVGQNALSQARLFSEAIPITGIVLTKLDGTAKGGIIVAIAKKFGIPIKFIGVGEKVDDLQEFDAERFVDALFAE